MDRRHFLAGTVGALAGCLGSYCAPTSGARPDTQTPEVSTSAPDIASFGFPSTICSADIDAGRIPAIVEPAFADSWTGVAIPDRYLRSDFEHGKTRSSGLPDHHQVIGLRQGDTARAYPMAVLFWHEIVTDTLEAPVMVSFCVNCSSGLVAHREIDGTVTRFGVTGQLWQPPNIRGEVAIETERVFAATNANDTDGLRARNAANLVMFDEFTRSYWSQLLGRAICGPLNGTTLRLLPSTFTTWGEWRGQHPDTKVMLPPFMKLIDEPTPESAD